MVNMNEEKGKNEDFIGEMYIRINNLNVQWKKNVNAAGKEIAGDVPDPENIGVVPGLVPGSEGGVVLGLQVEAVDIKVSFSTQRKIKK